MKWKPKEGEKYWYLHFSAYNLNWGEILFSKYHDYFLTDFNMVKIGNCFRTKKEAQAKLKEIMELLKK